MGQVPRGSAKATDAIGAATQRSQAPTTTLSREFGSEGEQ